MKVSVIIPAYKAQDYIAETIASVQAQDMPDWELIVIDDGSPDATGALVQRLAEQDARIVYHRQDNAGVSAARNKGYSMSRGAYIAFLDADDLWLPDNLSAKIALFEADAELGLVHSDTAVIDADSQETGEIKRGKAGYILKDLLLWEGTCIPAPSSILVKRGALEEVGGFALELSNAADFEFFFRVASKYKIGRVPRVTWQYRVHGENMHQNMELMEADELRAYALADKHGLFESAALRRQAYCNMYLILAASWWGHKRRLGKTLKFLGLAALKSPSTVLNKLWKKLWKSKNAAQ